MDGSATDVRCGSVDGSIALQATLNLEWEDCTQDYERITHPSPCTEHDGRDTVEIIQWCKELPWTVGATLRVVVEVMRFTISGATVTVTLHGDAGARQES